MASPRKFIHAVKQLSPKISQFSAPLKHSSPRTPIHTLKKQLSPLNIDTPNRCKIINNGLQNQKPIIGVGGFGTVYKASYKGAEVAVKILKRESSYDDVLEGEKHAANLRHSNIVRMLGFDQGEALSLITMELCGPSLQNMLEEKPLSTRERVLFCRDVACALKYCHGAGVIHADVKPKNIFIAENGRAKLGDFGSSILTSGNKEEHAGHVILKGTAGYEAPEVVRGQSPTTKSDIYSLGIVAWQMLFRKRPFAGLHVHVILYLTGKGYKPKESNLADGFGGKYKELYREMWSTDPYERLSLHLIIQQLNQLEKLALY